jgi:hypothetical protein
MLVNIIVILALCKWWDVACEAKEEDKRRERI